MKSWYVVYLHDFLESNTLVIEFRYRFLPISIVPPISFWSVEELFSKPIILFSYMNLWMNKHIIKKAKLTRERLKKEGMKNRRQ